MTRSLLHRVIVYDEQVRQVGGLPAATERLLSRLADEDAADHGADASASAKVAEAAKSVGMDRGYVPGTILVREWQGRVHHVMVRQDGYTWNNNVYGSLSRVAREITGKSWNGHVFFGGRGKALAARRRSNKDGSKT